MVFILLTFVNVNTNYILNINNQIIYHIKRLRCTLKSISKTIRSIEFCIKFLTVAYIL